MSSWMELNRVDVIVFVQRIAHARGEKSLSKSECMVNVNCQLLGNTAERASAKG